MSHLLNILRSGQEPPKYTTVVMLTEDDLPYRYRQDSFEQIGKHFLKKEVREKSSFISYQSNDGRIKILKDRYALYGIVDKCYRIVGLDDPNEMECLVEVVVRIRENETKKTVEVNKPILFRLDSDYPNHFEWSENNNSCDCNRSILFHNSSNTEEVLHSECTEGYYSVEIVNPVTNLISYTEFEYTLEELEELIMLEENQQILKLKNENKRNLDTSFEDLELGDFCEGIHSLMQYDLIYYREGNRVKIFKR